MDPDRQLAGLGQVGFSVSALQDACLAQYLEWHRTRLNEILSFVMALDPPPDIVVLPEYSVPWQCLTDVHASVGSHSTLVFAGTHTISTHPDALRVYHSLGIDQDKVFRFSKVLATAAIPLLAADRTKLLSKTSRSPYEKTELSPPTESIPKIGPHRVGRGANSYRILPLICSEALQPFNIAHNYDLSVVLSAEAKPTRFDSFIDREISTRHPVIYYNYARYGCAYSV